MLLSGYFPASAYAYALGSLDTDLPFAELKPINLITAKARAADQDPKFSVRIGAGPPRAPCAESGRRTAVARQTSKNMIPPT